MKDTGIAELATMSDAGLLLTALRDVQKYALSCVEIHADALPLAKRITRLMLTVGGEASRPLTAGEERALDRFPSLLPEERALVAQELRVMIEADPELARKALKAVQELVAS